MHLEVNCEIILSLNFYILLMSFGIEAKKLKTIIDLYHPENSGQELKYMIQLKGQEQLFRNLQTCPFQGISQNSVEDRQLTYGKNKLEPRNISIASILIKALNEPYIYIPILLTACLLINRQFTSNLQDKNIHQCYFLLAVTVLNWFLRSVQELYLCIKWAKIDIQMDDELCTVIRENKRQKIYSSELTVGDIVQFKEGETIPADGWLIEGFDVTIIQKYLSEIVEVQKDTLKKCITEIKLTLEKKYNVNQKNIELDAIKCLKSPVMLSGSTVKMGEGRMLVLCVGKHSRRGQFLALSRQRFSENIMKEKINKVMATTFNYLLAFSVLYFLTYISVAIFHEAMIHELKLLLKLKEWYHLEFGFIVLMVGAPQGLHLTLLASMICIKVRLWFAEGIWVDYSENMTKMASVTEICYDKQKNWEKVQYKEWWNEQKYLFKKDGEDQFQKQYCEMTEQSYIDDTYSSQNFKELMTKSLKFKNSQHPGQQYLVALDATLKKNLINDWHIFEQIIDNRSLCYLCEGNTIKYVTMLFQTPKNGKTIFIKGQGSDILHLCSHMLMKSTGANKQLTNDFRNEVKEVIQSMNRRLVTTHAICYFTCKDGSLQTQLSLIMQKQMTLLYLMGVSNTKDHTEYQLVRKLKAVGINLILVSSKGLQESINRSKYIGINTLEEDNLVLQGDDFIKVVGGVICFNCKKSYCTCQEEENYDPRLKNLEEFRRITKYFKVMSSATYFEKYSLMIGYRNISVFTAYMGIENEDNPAQTNSYLPITSAISNANLTNSEVHFPSNSLKTLCNFISWSRFSCQFVRKLMQLLLPASIVPAIIMLFSGIFFQMSPFGILQILWVCVILCGVSGLNLSWEKPQDSDMQDSSENFDKDSSLLTETVKKQIISQCIFQSFLILILLVCGHQFLAESYDKVDEIIGADWAAKYSNESKDKVASGLYRNLLLPINSYEKTFLTYGIYSRHLTIIFNTYALMQIFNYFNCRKIGLKQINIIQGMQIQNFVLFVLTLLAHFVFMYVALDYASLYPVGLIVEQWLLSAGLALVVVVVGFIVRMLPESSKERSNKRRWANKSYNLSVKLVGKSDKFYEFDREEDILFKYR